jgi:hypothetical protein
VRWPLWPPADAGSKARATLSAMASLVLGRRYNCSFTMVSSTAPKPSLRKCPSSSEVVT